MLLGPVSDETAEEAAQLIAADLLRLAEGSPYARSTWLRVARGLGIQISAFNNPSAPPGWYIPEQYPEEEDAEDEWAVPYAPIIVLNEAYPLETQVRVLVHELAHDRLVTDWTAPKLSGTPPADERYYDDDRDDLHEWTARRVEEVVIG